MIFFSPGAGTAYWLGCCCLLPARLPATCLLPARPPARPPAHEPTADWLSGESSPQGPPLLPNHPEAAQAANVLQVQQYAASRRAHGGLISALPPAATCPVMPRETPMSPSLTTSAPSPFYLSWRIYSGWKSWSCPATTGCPGRASPGSSLRQGRSPASSGEGGVARRNHGWQTPGFAFIVLRRPATGRGAGRGAGKEGRG